MSQLTIKNHFVPQTYLRAWENSAQKVYVYRSLVSHQRIPLWKPHSVSAIAYHKHLYTLVLNGKESDEIENWFCNEFESPATPVIHKVTNDKPLTKEDWHILVRFLAAQDVRTPVKMIEHMTRVGAIMSETLQKVLDDVKEELDTNGIKALRTRETSRKDTNPFPLKITTKLEEDKDTATLRAESYVGRSTWLFSIKHVLENTAKILHGHRWSIVKPAKGCTWFTSDNPVIKLNYVTKNEYDLLGGWGKNKGNIIFPLGPEHAMFVQIGDEPFPKGTRLTIDQTIFLRKIIAENSHRMIFSNFEDHDVSLFKPRVVNEEVLKQENLEMENWHSKNAKMESEYFKFK